MTNMDITQQLFAMQDKEYRDFHAHLLPTVERDNIIGIRVPMIKAFASKLYKASAYSDFLSALPHDYFDENALHAQIINLIKDYDECMTELERFLPFVDNWAVCDALKPKVFKAHSPEVEAKAYEWLNSDKTYTVRYAINAFMSLTEPYAFKYEHMQKISALRSDEYYIKMMQAWYFAEALTKNYDTAVLFIKDNKLDKWTHNKAIQKARESYRISPETKAYLNTLKIK